MRSCWSRAPIRSSRSRARFPAYSRSWARRTRCRQLRSSWRRRGGSRSGSARSRISRRSATARSIWTAPRCDSTRPANPCRIVRRARADGSAFPRSSTSSAWGCAPSTPSRRNGSSPSDSSARRRATATAGTRSWAGPRCSQSRRSGCRSGCWEGCRTRRTAIGAHRPRRRSCAPMPSWRSSSRRALPASRRCSPS